MRILCVGGCGFVGANLSLYFAKLGHNVTTLDNLVRRGSELNLPDFRRHGINFKHGDIRNPEDIQGEYDVILECSAQPSATAGYANPMFDFHNNTVGLMNVLEHARKTGAAVVFWSCYDKETRAVTKSGLKRYDEIRKGDTVLSINPSTGQIEEKEVEDVIIQKYSGKMYHHKGSRYDFMVTPNHRIMYQGRSGNKPTGYYGFKRADEISKQSQFYLPQGKWKGRAIDKIQITEHTPSIKLGKSRINNINIVDTDKLFYLTGIFIGDGSMSLQSRPRKYKNGKTYTCNGSAIFLDIPTKDKARKRVEQTLVDIGIDYKAYKIPKSGQERLYFSSALFCEFFKSCGSGAHNKHVPSWMLDFDPEYLRHLYDGLLDSDGYAGKTFHTVSEFLRRDMIELCSKLGKETSTTLRHCESYIGKRKVSGSAYRLNISRTPRMAFRKNLKIVEYDDVVWCLKVKDNANFLSERNGKVVFSGNTNKVYSGDKINNISAKEASLRYVWDSDGQRGWSLEKGINEDFPIDGGQHSVYGLTKAMSDLACQEYWDAFGVPTIVNRFSCLAGPRQWGKTEQGWVSWFIIAKHLGLPVKVCGWKGKQVRDVLFIDDVCALIDTEMAILLNQPERAMDGVAGQVFNIGGGLANSISIKEFMHRYSLRPASVEPERKGDHRIYITDNSKAERLLGWKPLVDLDEGLNQIEKWVVDNKAILEGLYR